MNTCIQKILVASLGLCAASNLVAQVTLTTLYSFSNAPDGGGPSGVLIQVSDGSFYGTTVAGGTSNAGTVFRITSDGTYTNLYSFTNNPDGSEPFCGLVPGSDGNFYGTTEYGGTKKGGTVFRISPSGNYTNLYSFTNHSDGSQPYGGLALGADGSFYGMTTGGGSPLGGGTVFLLTTNGNVSILHSFTGNPDGAVPYGPLVRGSDGNFYGTTAYGGTGNLGTVIRVSPGGSVTILHSFTNATVSGFSPDAGLCEGNDGNFYGVTIQGGTNGTGTVFRISPNGSCADLFSFPNDGLFPNGGLVLGSDGNFYGTVTHGGIQSRGTMFRISSSGSYTNLYTFNDFDGAYPSAGLIQGIDGNFYGTTASGGGSGSGTVFKLVVPLDAPANQINAVQIATTNVLITIPSVAAAFYQLQYRDSPVDGAWSNVDVASATSIGGPLTVTNFGGFSQSQRFYRFVITP